MRGRLVLRFFAHAPEVRDYGFAECLRKLENFRMEIYMYICYHRIIDVRKRKFVNVLDILGKAGQNRVVEPNQVSV